MPRASKSQWDFGELFPPEDLRRVLTVSELTIKVKRLLEQQVGTLWVAGEISNLRKQASGHIYFTLKDAVTQVACVLFRAERVAHRPLLEDGQMVVVEGDVTVYEARGQYQLIVRKVELEGVGALQVAFEKLKQKLAAEGLFAESRKRPVPRFPRCVGIVTSSTGAAFRDVLHVAQRRDPALQMILVPCRVQGQGAASEITRAIRLLNEYSCARNESDNREYDFGAGPPFPIIDVILLTRGGGSLEDLWAFNEEEVARAIAASMIPVVSAVGHEIDYTISDFVADFRAPTPSAAAELLTEGVFSVTRFVRESTERLRKAVLGFTAEARENLDSLRGRMGRAHPRRRLNEAAQRLDDLQSSLERSMRGSFCRAELDWKYLAGRFLRCQPAPVINRARGDLERMRLRMAEMVGRSYQALADHLNVTKTRLQLLGPEQVLFRGYSITTDLSSGRVLRNAFKLTKGQKVRTQFHKGTVVSTVDDSPQADATGQDDDGHGDG